MKTQSHGILLRVFMIESASIGGKSLYQYLVEYLYNNSYAGVTVVRAIAGFGHMHRVHTSNILDLSTDLPIIVEVMDTKDKIESLKNMLDHEGMEYGLMTEQEVTITSFSKK